MSFSEGLSELLKGFLAKPKVSTISVGNEQRQLEALYSKTKSDFKKSSLATVKTYDFATLILSSSIEEASKKTGLDYSKLPQDIIEQLLDTTVRAIKEERFFDFPEIDFERTIPLSRQIELQKYLEQIELRIYDRDEVLLCFYNSFSHALVHFLYCIKSLVYADTKPNSFSLDITYLLENLGENLEQIIISFFNAEIGEYGLFVNLRERLLENADFASGFSKGRSEQERQEKLVTLPSKSKLVGTELIEGYLEGTYLHNFFEAKIDFAIPTELRLEHCHILAGTGHGKTQLIQKLILEDIEAGRGFMVIDSQGDMIHKISMLKVFDPSLANTLADKLVIIDPEDVDYPAALNMFSLDSSGSEVSTLQKQMLINSTVDLYEYMFGALFGSELTSKQGVIFRYVAKLMAEIPNATIHTLRELLEDGKQYQSDINRLEGSVKAFFDTQFFSTSFGQTKKQILSRLWVVLSNQTLENLFSSKKNSVDLFDAISSGKIVLVNTSKQLLQSSGSQILGRFFIALLSQAVIKRATIPESSRKPYMVYVDEAQEYFDSKLEDMLNQARKYKVGFTLSHQNLGQLGSLKSTVFSSTSVKLAGGISARDASDMASEMKCRSDFLLSMEKSPKNAEFACYLKNAAPYAIPLWFEFGLLEKKPVMSVSSFEKLIGNIRERYCSHVSDLSYGSGKVEATKPTPELKEQPVRKATGKPVEESVIEPEPKIEKKKEETLKATPESLETKPEVVEVKPEDKGGLTHRYLQNLVKKIGQERGFYCVIENQVFDGLGSVDVSLEGFGHKIAVEVSVSTQGKWEASNITKCFSASYDYVVLISSEKDHLKKLQSVVAREFSTQLKDKKLLFFQPEELIAFLDGLKAKSAQNETTVSGYKVKVNFTPSDSKENELREEAIAKVILGR